MNPVNAVPQHIAAVILDMDGTLLDTERMYKACTFETLTRLGWPDRQDLIRAMVGLSSKKCDALLMATLGPAFPLEAYHDAFQACRATKVAQGIALKTGATELIASLSASGLPFAIATSSTRYAAEHHLTAAGLRPYFDTVVTADDVAEAKPSPDLYLEAARRLGVDPAGCFAVEDSGHGVRSAHAAGMTTLLVPDMVVPDADVVALCAAVFKDLFEALDYMAQHVPALRVSV